MNLHQHRRRATMILESKFLASPIPSSQPTSSEKNHAALPLQERKVPQISNFIKCLSVWTGKNRPATSTPHQRNCQKSWNVKFPAVRITTQHNSASHPPHADGSRKLLLSSLLLQCQRFLSTHTIALFNFFIPASSLPTRSQLNWICAADPRRKSNTLSVPSPETDS